MGESVVRAVATIDANAGTATLGFLPDSNQVASWTYSSGRVVLSERIASVQLSLTNAHEVLRQAKAWRRMIVEMIGAPEPSACSIYRVEYSVDAEGAIEMRAVILGETVKAEWKSESGMRYFPRARLDLSWSAFEVFLEWHEKLLEMVARYESGFFG